MTYKRSEENDAADNTWGKDENRRKIHCRVPWRMK